MIEEPTQTGIGIVGDMPWGTHFCHFYETKADLLATLVPYFKAGLESNEYCLWVISKPLSEADATNALRTAVPGIDQHLLAGDLEIISHRNWYLKNGGFGLQKMVAAWKDKVDEALAKGHAGIRVSGNTAWVAQNGWKDFAAYEKAVGESIGDLRMKALCTYALSTCGAAQVLDVVSAHQFALARRNGELEVVETSETRKAKAETEQLNQDLEDRVLQRTRELAMANEELRRESIERERAETELRRDITKRQLAAEALREAEQKYRDIFENAGEGIFQSTPEGQYIAANPALARMHGFDSPEELICSRNDISRDVYVDLARREEFKRLLQEHGVVRGFEHQMIRKDGSTFWTSVNARAVRDEQGNIRYYEGTALDITERKRLADGLRQSEASLANAQRIAQIGSWDWDIQNNQLVWSEEQDRIFGIDPADFGSYFEAAVSGIPPDDVELIKAAVDAALAQVAPYNIEHRVIRPDGVERVVHGIGEVTFDQSGKPLRMSGTVQDITERKQAEEDLIKQKEILQKIFDYTPMMITFISADGRTRLVNREWERTLGWSMEEVTSGDLDVFEGLYPDPTYREEVLDCIVKGRAEWADFRTRVRDGRIIDTTWANVLLSDGISIGIGKDITAHKRAEAELRESEERYRDLVENSEELICTHDLEGRILSANRAAGVALGYQPQDYAGKRNLRDLLAPEVRDQFADYLASLQKEGFAKGLMLVQTSTGERRIWEYYNTLRTQGVATPIVRGMARDITDRKQAEQALLASERKYRDIFTFAPVGIYQSLRDGTLITANKALAEMLGFGSVDELLRVKLGSGMYFAEDEREQLIRKYEVPGYGVDVDMQWKRKDGSPICVQLSAHAIKGPNGETEYFEGFVHDTTERKRAEARSAAFATLARKLSGALTQLDAGRIIAETADDLFRWDSCNLDLYDAERDLVHPMVDVDTIGGKRTDFAAFLSDRKPTARGQRVIDHGPELILREEPIQFDEDSIPFGDTLRPSASIMSVPIRHAASIIGLLSIQSYTPRAYDAAALSDFQALADHCGEALNRIRAEEELRESEERYRDLVENSQEFICTHDLNGLILSVNRAASEVLGYDLKDYCGKKNFRDLLVPEVRDQFDDYLARIRRDGVASGLTLVQTSSGERRILKYHNTVRTEGVATPIVRGMARDITEQRRAEKATSNLRRELELTMNSMEEGVHRVDLEGNIVFQNPAAAHMLGWGIDQLLGKTAHLTIHHTRQDGTTYPNEECPIFATLRDGISRNVADEVFWRQDGTSFPVEYMTAPMHNDRNEIVAAVVTFLNITARKRVEAALRESEERYRELFENAKDAIYVHDLSGKYTSVNRAAERLSGYLREEILGKNFAAFVAPEHLKQVREKIWNKLRDEGETTYEMDVIARDGQHVPVEVSSRLIYDRGVIVGVQGMARDITDRKRAQDALRFYSRRLIEAQEEERQRIARELHDQIGQVLTAVQINLHTLQQVCDCPAASPHFEDSIKVLDEALDQVRDLSFDLRPSMLDDLGLVPALRWYVARQTRLTCVRAEVISELPDHNVRFGRDLETACFRIAQEALTNVARHAHAQRVSVRLRRDETDLLVIIKDDGVGFDVDALRRRSPSAATLGLQGMQERAQAVEGTIEIDSAPSRGTEIRFRLPFNGSNEWNTLNS